jgi:GR25 family glycosyltransferase involved in LPS biosynthesis
MNQSNPNSAWDFFERIYCISLQERKDRRQQALMQFDNVGLASRVEFVLVQRHPIDCEQGIFESHQECIRRGLVAGAGAILIFEDDVVFEHFSNERLARCTSFLASRKNWNAFFLGCLAKKAGRTECPSVRSISYRCLAHAYALNRPFAETLARKSWRNIPFDGMLGTFTSGFYAMYPSCAFQSDASSDNSSHRILDRVRRGLGGLRRIQKANQWRLAHRNLLIAGHLAAVLALAALALKIWT